MSAMEFCLRCGARLENKPLAERVRQVCPRCDWILYRNPVPVVAAWVERNRKILLLKRCNEPLRGFWAPPTGYVEWDESAAQAAARETFEETGFEIQVDALLSVHSRANAGILFVVYRAHIIGGQARLSDEVEEIMFCAPKDFPMQPDVHAGTALDEFFLDVIHTITNSFIKRVS